MAKNRRKPRPHSGITIHIRRGRVARPRRSYVPNLAMAATRFPHSRTPTRPARARPSRSTIRSNQVTRVIRDASRWGPVAVKQQTRTRPVLTRKVTQKGTLSRLVVHPTACIRRKEYKKTMLRQIAAQKARQGALGSWRIQRRHATPQVHYSC